MFGWLVHWTLGREVWVRDLVGGGGLIMFCSSVKHFTLPMPLSTQDPGIKINSSELSGKPVEMLGTDLGRRGWK